MRLFLFPGKGKHAHLLSIFNMNVFKNFPVLRIAYAIDSEENGVDSAAMETDDTTK